MTVTTTTISQLSCFVCKKPFPETNRLGKKPYLRFTNEDISNDEFFICSNCRIWFFSVVEKRQLSSNGGDK